MVVERASLRQKEDRGLRWPLVGAPARVPLKQLAPLPTPQWGVQHHVCDMEIK